MLMKKFAFFLVIFYSSLFVAQEARLDSIVRQLAVYKQRDSVRVQILNEVTSYYATRNITKNHAILDEAISISKELNYTKGLIDSYANLSSLYIQEGNFDKGLQYALEAKKTQQKTQDTAGIIYSNTNIARIYNEMGDTANSIALLKENLQLCKNNPKSKDVAQIYFYLGNNYLTLKKYELATSYFMKARENAQYNNFKTGEIVANASLGVVEVERGNYVKAKNYLHEVYSYYKKTNQESYLAHAASVLAKAYNGLKDYKQALAYNATALSIYKKQGNLKNLQKRYLLQSQILEKQKNYQQSNYFLKKYNALKDSILSKEKIEFVKEMQIKYETDKIKAEKELAESELQITEIQKKTNRNLFIAAVLIGMLILFSSLFYYSRLKLKKKAEIISLELKEAQKRLALEKQYKNSELKALKAQMNPHFIFNALNSIQDYIVLNQKNMASDYLGKFADLIRNYLYFSDIGYISIPDEVNNLKLYLALEKLRFEDELTYNFNIEGKANKESIYIPTMLIQPYVENALKHGLLHKKGDRKLSISISKLSETLIECIVEDNGIGRERSKTIQHQRQKHHQSFATKASTERLQLLNYGKEKKIGIKVFDLHNNGQAVGVKVVLNIPILKKNHESINY